MKKIYKFWFFLIVIFFIFLLFILLPKTYKKKYKINDIEITENYNKKNKYYYFTFKRGEVTLDYLLENSYKRDRKLINDIEIIKDEDNEDNFCVLPKSNKLNFIPLCYQENNIIYYESANKNIKQQLDSNLFKKVNKIETYKDIEIYNNDFTYLLWNYDGFYYINKNEKKKINLFDKELYNVSFVGLTNDYLVIADYDSNYTFNHFYRIDFKKGNLKKYEIDRDVYFDSNILGYEKDKLYIVDNKASLMYELNVKKGKIEKIKSKVLVGGKWENRNIKTLINKNITFTYKTNFNYELIDDNLYLDYKKDIKTLVNTGIKSIVKIDNSDIFYLKGSDLYHFNPTTGEEKILSYFEWNFNYERMIYIH